ncbi:MAG: protein-disulfide reductase DsbD family protein [Candidatus Nanoarchaeia archaeon]
MHILSVYFVLLVFFTFTQVAFATDNDEGKLFSAEWLYATDDFNDEGIIEAGILIKLKPGWHSYGPEPGDFGMPPRIKFSNSEGLEISPPQYPPTKEFKESAGISYGYSEAFLVKFKIKTLDRSKIGKININFQALLCKDICVPVDLYLELPPPQPCENKENRKEKWMQALKIGGWNK